MNRKQLVEQIRIHMDKLGEPMPKKGSELYYELVTTMSYMNFLADLMEKERSEFAEGFYAQHLVTFSNKRYFQLFLRQLSGDIFWTDVHGSRGNYSVKVVRYFKQYNREDLVENTLWIANASTSLGGTCWTCYTRKKNIWLPLAHSEKNSLEGGAV